jgi:cell division protein FtsI (penicillin-binding protein 3)
MMNSVATGGEFVPPRIVQAVVQPDGSVRELSMPREHRVLSPGVTSELTGMLEQVVSNDGTAAGAAVAGYTVAGKTGTAQIPNPKAPGYLEGAYMATFTGFAPAQDPALSASVVLNRPTPIYGGKAAAPVFSQVMAYALQRYGIPPSASQGADSTGTDMTGTVPGLAQGGTGAGTTGSRGADATANSGGVVAGTASPPGSPGTIAQSAGQNARSP